MGRLRLFGELIEAGGAVEGGGGGGGGGGHQIARVVRTSGDYQTESTSWINIDTANLVINMTTGPNHVLLILSGSLVSMQSGSPCFDFTIDGVRQGEAAGINQLPAYYETNVSVSWLVEVAAGSHVFRPQWRVTAGTAVLQASSAKTPLLFAVLELQ